MASTRFRGGWWDAGRFFFWIGCGVTPILSMAGPPYVTDDPQPTDTGHYEIYFFDSGNGNSQGISTARGVDFNYGVLSDTQLTITIPFEEQRASNGARESSGLTNIELGVKYRLLHQAESGWDVAIFPRVFFPSPSTGIGARHGSLLLPIWLEKDWAGGWSTFGGGGCEVNRGGDSKDFCLAGWALTRQVIPSLQLGVEIVHQTADSGDGRVSTAVGGGLKYDFNERWHFLAYAGPSLQNVATNDRYDWYTSILLTL